MQNKTKEGHLSKLSFVVGCYWVDFILRSFDISVDIKLESHLTSKSYIYFFYKPPTLTDNNLFLQICSFCLSGFWGKGHIENHPLKFKVIDSFLYA